MSERTAGGIQLPVEDPDRLPLDLGPSPAERIRWAVLKVDAERRIHALDMALALSGGKPQTTRAAVSWVAVDTAISELIEAIEAVRFQP